MQHVANPIINVQSPDECRHICIHTPGRDDNFRGLLFDSPVLQAASHGPGGVNIGSVGAKMYSLPLAPTPTVSVATSSARLNDSLCFVDHTPRTSIVLPSLFLFFDKRVSWSSNEGV